MNLSHHHHTMTTPTTIADAVRQLIKTDNDAPRLIAEALQEIPELGLASMKEYAQLEAAAANARARSAERIDQLHVVLDRIQNLLAEEEGGDE